MNTFDNIFLAIGNHYHILMKSYVNKCVKCQSVWRCCFISLASEYKEKQFQRLPLSLQSVIHFVPTERL